MTVAPVTTGDILRLDLTRTPGLGKSCQFPTLVQTPFLRHVLPYSLSRVTKLCSDRGVIDDPVPSTLCLGHVHQKESMEATSLEHSEKRKRPRSGGDCPFRVGRVLFGIHGVLARRHCLLSNEPGQARNRE